MRRRYRSSTTSLGSSLTSYKYENGRRYHAFREGQYLIPNDEEEQERLDIVHHQMLVVLDGKLHICPLTNPQRILDIGTGTGIWAIDMANEFESAEIIGTDLSPIQPRWVPPNCRFEVDDAESDWTWPRNHFDMIHARHVGFAIKNWTKFIGQIYDHLVPGGWVQLSEHDIKAWSDDDSFPKDSDSAKVINAANEAIALTGLDPDFLPKMRGWLEAQGFTEIQEVHYKMPWGVWPKDKKLKEIGKWWLLEVEAGGLESYFLAMFTRVLGWPAEKANRMIAGMKAEIKTQKQHAYIKGNFLIGRKPLKD
ncbi:S-adenosyl-L-methionine-dependent methyltransferase [Peziza echinospora]|nr:S-adenosyl-L-methionine-dependent methyltransferase [Peziza echinospora]